jgi:hypothetical protein
MLFIKILFIKKKNIIYFIILNFQFLKVIYRICILLNSLILLTNKFIVVIK